MALIVEQEQLRELIDHYSQKDRFVFDVETIGEDRANPHKATLAWISMATDDRIDVIPLGHPHGELEFEGPAVLVSGQRKLAAGKTREDLKPYDFSKNKIERRFAQAPTQIPRHIALEMLAELFGDDSIEKIGHNVKFDLHVMRQYLGRDRVVGPYYDTMITSWLIDSSRGGRLGLKDCVQRELGVEMEKGVGKDISLHSFTEVYKYSALDAELTWALMEALEEQIDSAPPSMRRLLDLEHLLLEPVLDMESNGVLVDRDLLDEIDKDLRKSLEELQATIYKLAGRRFNLRSNRDKQEVLFKPKKEGGQGLKPDKLVASAEGKPSPTIYDYAVDQVTLDKYRGKSPLVDAMLEFTAKTKLHGTYVLPFVGGYPPRDTADDVSSSVKFVKSRLVDGRIFGQFKQHGTESGRFSSANPNLQNIPSRSEEGKKIRKTFIADPGTSLIVADYSQIEPRIIASLSGDKTMVRTYRDGGDVYQAVGDRMGVDRAHGKELVLSIAYGIGPNTISKRIGCTVQQARDLMTYFSQKFPSIPAHRAEVLRTARRNKYSETVLGRRRPLPRIVWRDNDEERSRAERQAYNHVIQGTAADIMKIALVNMYEALPPEALMLMTVHDEVVVQAPDDMAEDVMKIIVTEMEAAKPKRITVPLVAEAKIALNWADGK